MRKITERAKSFWVLLRKTNHTFLPKEMKWKIVTVLVLFAFTSQFWFFGSWVFGQLMDMLTKKESIFTGVPFVFAILGIFLVDAFFRTCTYVRGNIQRVVDFYITDRVQKTFWGAYIKYDLQDRENSKMQDALGNAQNNQDAVAEVFGIEIDFMISVLTVLVAIAALSLIQWWYSLVVIALVLPRFLFVWKRKNKEYVRSKRMEELKRYRSAMSSFMRTKDARINTANANIFTMYNSLRKRFQIIGFRNSNFFNRISWANDILFYAAEGAMLLSLVYLVNSGVKNVGVLFIFFTAFNNLFKSLTDITEKLISIGITAKKIEDFFLVLEGKPAIVDIEKPQEVDDKKAPLIEFRNVWFKYPETEEWIIKNCNFSVAPGERVGLVARNGEGKTTLALLLLRFYDVSEGSILINGIDIRMIRRDSLFAITGVLFQDFNLLEGSVKLALSAYNFKRSFSDEKLWDSLQKVGMKEYVQNLKNGLHHKISKIFSDSKKLSGGQNQKIGLAGIVCKEPQLLILDEFTSALDPTAEAEIIQQYEKISKGKTCLIISHRYNTLDLVDKILILEKGTIAESGTKKKLLQLPQGVFKSLYTASRLLPEISLS